MASLIERFSAMVLAPSYRGYANLGTGKYLLLHSREGDSAELCIVPATDEEKAGRTVGVLSNYGPDEVPAERIAVRLRFENVEGLNALEQQLRLLRDTHFPDTAPPSATVEVNREYCPCMEESCPKCYAQQPAAVDEVRIPVTLVERVQSALGKFTSGDGWCVEDMQTADDFGAALAAQQGVRDDG